MGRRVGQPPVDRGVGKFRLNGKNIGPLFLSFQLFKESLMVKNKIADDKLASNDQHETKQKLG
ncbi:hypothetical protein Csa_021038 [Cucumis sativus]|nr:hypothetical protein Csa_021038 [Cucumis sativus]